MPLKLVEFVRTSYWLWQILFFAIVTAAVLVARIVSRRSKAFRFPLGSNDGRNVILTVAASLLLFLLLTLISGVREPSTHDEFVYLYAADTFTHGRLANPTPVSPRSFESYHVLVEPVYTSKYPPIQGVFLAVGKFVTDLPIAGVWLSSVFAALVLMWLLRAFFSPQWALWGTLLWVCSPLNIIWSGYYWGGHAAMIGGALSLGAFFRHRNRPSARLAAAWAGGVFLLFHSRPFEGVILTTTLVILYAADLVKSRFESPQRWPATVLCIGMFLSLASVALYDLRITGDPFQIPYALQHRQYHHTPLFVFDDAGTPTREVPRFIKELDDRWMSEFQADYGTRSAALKSTGERLLIYPAWLTRSPFLLILLACGFIAAVYRRTREDVYILVPIAASAVGLLLTTFTGDRFAAPITGLAVILMTFGARRVIAGASYLRPLVAALPFIVIAGYLAGLFMTEASRKQHIAASFDSRRDGFASRREIEDHLIASAGKDIIFVETTNVNPADPRFYVYNEADMANAEIIWAHRLSDTENRTVTGAFPNRNIWLLKNDGGKARLTPFEGED